MGELAKKALETIKKQGGRVVDRDRIEVTLKEIGQAYRPGLIGWIREDRDRWARLLEIEDWVNKAALSGDEMALKNALSEYRGFFKDLLNGYGIDETLPLFGGRG